MESQLESQAESTPKQTENQPDKDQNSGQQSQLFMDSELLLLILILFIFFNRPNRFSEKLQLIDDQVKTVKEYLETADATLQALDQASQIPTQKLN